MTNTIWGYLLWAIIQHAVVLVPLAIWYPKWCLGVAIFGVVFHLPNWRLMLITSGLALVFYPGFFIFSYWFAAPLVVVHAFGGRELLKRGVDLRVWRFR